MSASESAIRQLCQQLQIDSVFFEQCLQESIVEIRETEGRVELANGTIIRLRQLERICTTLSVNVPVAKLVVELNQKVAELEDKIQRLRQTK